MGRGSGVVVLDGDSLTSLALLRLSRASTSMEVARVAWERVAASRAVVEGMLEKREVAYGINTGFGLFSNVIIDEANLELLQDNLVSSHAAGVGEPLSPARTRMLLALRINVLCRGNSGVSTETLRRLVLAFNANCISVVPSQGTVGASGDLAPLAHLALGLIGKGLMWDEPPPEPNVDVNDDRDDHDDSFFSFDGIEAQGSGQRWPAQAPAAEVLAKRGVTPVVLGAYVLN